MARDLDTLIRQAKAQEAASLVDRGRVREALAQRIASGPLPPNAVAANRLPIVGASVLAVAAAAGIAIAIGSGFGAKLRASGYEPPPAVHEQQPSDVELPPATTQDPPPPAPSQSENPDLLAQPLVPADPQAEPPAHTDPQVDPFAQSDPLAPAEPRRLRRKPPPLPPRLDFKGLTMLEAESRHLAETERYLREGGIPPAILMMLMIQDRTFRNGALQAERDALRVLTWCAWDDVEKAKKEAESFLRAHPTSPVRARVLNSCVNPKSKSKSKSP